MLLSFGTLFRGQPAAVCKVSDTVKVTVNVVFLSLVKLHVQISIGFQITLHAHVLLDAVEFAQTCTVQTEQVYVEFTRHVTV